MKKTGKKMIFIITAGLCILVVIAAVLITAGLKFFQNKNPGKEQKENSAPIAGHISKNNEALIVGDDGQTIVLDGQFAQCIVTGDRQHIIGLSKNGELFVFDENGKNAVKVADKSTFVDEHFVSDRMILYFDYSDPGSKSSGNKKLGCYIYDQQRQVDLGLGCGENFVVKDDQVFFAQKGNILHFNSEMDAPETIMKGQEGDIVIFRGISDNCEMAVWYRDNNSRREIYCWTDGKIELLDTSYDQLEDIGYVMVSFFNSGRCAVIYGTSYNKLLIKEIDQEPWEINSGKMTWVYDILENDSDWTIYYGVSNGEGMDLYCANSDRTTAGVTDNIRGVAGCHENNIYFCGMDNVLYRGSFENNDVSGIFQTEPLAEDAANSYVTDSGNGWLIMRTSSSDGAAASELWYGKPEAEDVRRAAENVYMFAFSYDDRGFYYIDQELSDDGSEALVLYYQDFSEETPVEIDRDVFLLDTDQNYYVSGPCMVYFKQIIDESDVDGRIEMYAYSNGEKKLISDSVAY